MFLISKKAILKEAFYRLFPMVKGAYLLSIFAHNIVKIPVSIQ